MKAVNTLLLSSLEGLNEGSTRFRKSVYMSAEALQYEIKRLSQVCEQLDSLASEHPFVGEALLGIAGSLRNSVTILELLVATKFSN